MKPTKICDIRCKRSICNSNLFSEVLNYKLNGFFNTSSNGHAKINKALRKRNRCFRKFKLQVRVTLKIESDCYNFINIKIKTDLLILMLEFRKSSLTSQKGVTSNYHERR